MPAVYSARWPDRGILPARLLENQAGWGNPPEQDNFNDRNLLLEMAQEYVPIACREVIGKGGDPLRVQTLVGIIKEARQARAGPEGPRR